MVRKLLNSLKILKVNFNLRVFFDCRNSGTFSICAIVSLLKPWRLPLPDSFQSILNLYHPRQLLVTGMMTIWSSRLAIFLFIRVLKVGHDSRFNRVKKKPAVFLIYWLIQALWIFITGLGVYSINALVCVLVHFSIYLFCF